MRYRPEIDGLRSIAVVPVILFHAGLSAFSGGYVGVDIFFVISGYLITHIITEDLQKEHFSILEFYERRARRILPALFLVVGICIPFGWIWMLPLQFKDFSQSIVATVLFSSNFHFWLEENYFDTGAGEKPLLHTWSLAVEEQYYVLFPFVLALLWRFKRQQITWLIFGAAIASLVACEWGWRNVPTANFYLALFRAWELLAGSLCALVILRGQHRASNLLSLLGLSMTLIPVFLFDVRTPFPSLYALVPVLGTVLIILYGTTDTWTARFLSAPLLVGIGLISYSAYLWHQPLFAFARMRSIFEPSPWIILLLALASFVLAYLSWRFVEKPFRKGPDSCITSRKAVFATSAFVGAVLLGIGAYGHLLNGKNANNAFHELRPRDVGPCFFRELPSSQSLVHCREWLGRRDFFVLIGDSHAQAISKSLREILHKNGKGLISMTQDGCLPVPRTLREGRSKKDSCLLFADHVFELAASLKPETVIVATRWALHIEGTRYVNSQGFVEEGTSARTFVAGDTSSWDVAQANLIKHIRDEFIRIGQTTPLVLVTEIPEVAWPVPKVAMLGGLNLLEYPYTFYAERNYRVIQLFESILAEGEKNLTIFDAAKVFCPPAIRRLCLQHKDRALLYFDDDHPSSFGSSLLSEALIESVVHHRLAH